MANKLAGQRAKFSRARAIYFTNSDETQRQRAVQLMAEVLAEAPASGFSEDDVTQGADVPSAVYARPPKTQVSSDENPDDLFNELQISVDVSELREVGQGGEFVYAYGYRCAPDRLKVGSCAGDVIARVAAQIGTAIQEVGTLHGRTVFDSAGDGPVQP